MKALVLGILVTLLATSSAYAGSTICAGKTIHYSRVTQDSGIAPRPGQKIGLEFLAVKGEVRGQRELFSGMHRTPDWTLSLHEIGERIEYYNKMSNAQSTRISEVQLSVVDDAGNNSIEIANELVVCTEKVAFVP